ncbi:MAG: long-chain acyl-CoA synthetase [Natronomonas sp.]|jgi:long-chain acyl-CoA synthetase|uniref:class I adenylate-forming enzyme family protein n=1 Tax=Natronomonas sp. TaxID=2184060 RepID=UPI003988E841
MNFAAELELQARSQPEAPALFFDDQMYTWRDIDERASRFANVLIEHGLEPGDHMAIFAPNIPRFVFAFYGAMKAGVVPMPLNLRFEPGEIDYMIDHVEHDAVFTAAPVAELFEEVGLSPVKHVYAAGDVDLETADTDVHDFDALLADASTDFEAVPQEMDDPCFFMHTSGTTGRAKPVIATHGNIYAHDMAYIQHIGFTTDDVALTAVPLFHNSGLNLKLTTFTMLGAPQVLLQQWDAEAALSAIEEHDVTYLFTIPTMLYDLVNRDPEESENAYDVTSLEYAPTGGQNVPVDPVTEFEDRYGATVLPGYGLTETMPGIVMNRPDHRKLETDGVPIRNACDIRVVDPEDWQTEVPTGELGELLVSGDVVSPGYYRRPEKNEEDFEVDEDGRRWLHTGDIVRQDDDGFISIEDRVDSMIVSGGENVYPNQVENVLYEIDGIDEAVVVGESHERWGERVAAAVVASDETLTEEDIFDYFKNHTQLANYKRPRNVLFLDELPRSGTGKIDRFTIQSEYFAEQ